MMRHAHGDPRVRVRALRAAAAYGQAVFARDVQEWLGEARISAVLLHTTKGNTYSHFTAQT